MSCWLFLKYSINTSIQASITTICVIHMYLINKNWGIMRLSFNGGLPNKMGIITTTKKVVISIVLSLISNVYYSKIAISWSIWYWIYWWCKEKSFVMVHIPVFFIYFAQIHKWVKPDQTLSEVIFVILCIPFIHQSYTTSYTDLILKNP